MVIVEIKKETIKVIKISERRAYLEFQCSNCKRFLKTNTLRDFRKKEKELASGKIKIDCKFPLEKGKEAKRDIESYHSTINN